MVKRLENIGREQFFWHYCKSTLAIRDIAEKTEPHIEIGAENYLSPCIQPNIRGFCNRPEKFLFLCTTCKNPDTGQGKFYGKRFVVGYIKKEFCKSMGTRLAVIGETFIVPFDEKLDYGSLGFKRSRGMQRFNKEDTERLLKSIHLHKNIRADCVREMIEKEKDERNKGNTVPIDDECLGDGCEFRHVCLRRNLR